VADFDRESILALDNIRLELPVANVGSRCLAGVIDGCAVTTSWSFAVNGAGACLGARGAVATLFSAALVGPGTAVAAVPLTVGRFCKPSVTLADGC